MLRRGRQPLFIISLIARATLIIETWPLTESDAPYTQASRCEPTMIHSSGATAPVICRPRYQAALRVIHLQRMWTFAGPGPMR
jgi:hypothetical protein